MHGEYPKMKDTDIKSFFLFFIFFKDRRSSFPESLMLSPAFGVERVYQISFRKQHRIESSSVRLVVFLFCQPNKLKIELINIAFI